MKIWKLLGLAGVAGVAATGVAATRAERHRRAYEPDDIRARLHQRHDEAVAAEAAFTPEVVLDADEENEPGRLRMRWRRIRRSLPRRKNR